MLFIIFVLVVFALHGTSALQCYEYEEQHLNYSVTSETIPLFLTNVLFAKANHQCTAMIQWFTLPDGTETYIDYYGDDGLEFLPKGSSLSFVRVSIEFDLQSASTRTLIYSCTTDYCNSRTNLQKLLSSLTLEEDFVELDILSSNDATEFTEQSSCVNFSNTTHLRCPQSASLLSKGGACVLMVMKSSDEFCARYLDTTPVTDVDYVKRHVFFFFENQTQVGDQITLVCRTKRCNELTNAEWIYELSDLEFNFQNFHIDSSTSNSTINLSVTLNFTPLFVVFTIILQFYYTCILY